MSFKQTNRGDVIRYNCLYVLPVWEDFVCACLSLGSTGMKASEPNEVL